MEKNTLVTITRQYGSGGREVADLVAKKMGVRRYDRKVVAMAAEKLGGHSGFAAVCSCMCVLSPRFLAGLRAACASGLARPRWSGACRSTRHRAS